MTGTVKQFDPTKGWGFITPDDGTPNVFVHFTGIQREGFKTLATGERVSFTIETTAKGPRAAAVVPLDVSPYADA